MIAFNINIDIGVISKINAINFRSLSGEDAKLAVKCGVEGIMVSNHGGRQLDGALATVSVPMLTRSNSHEK